MAAGAVPAKEATGIDWLYARQLAEAEVLYLKELLNGVAFAPTFTALDRLPAIWMMEPLHIGLFEVAIKLVTEPVDVVWFKVKGVLLYVPVIVLPLESPNFMLKSGAAYALCAIPRKTNENSSKKLPSQLSLYFCICINL
jgi:hypothetical protein